MALGMGALVAGPGQRLLVGLGLVVVLVAAALLAARVPNGSAAPAAPAASAPTEPANATAPARPAARHGVTRDGDPVRLLPRRRQKPLLHAYWWINRYCQRVSRSAARLESPRLAVGLEGLRGVVGATSVGSRRTFLGAFTTLLVEAERHPRAGVRTERRVQTVRSLLDHANDDVAATCQMPRVARAMERATARVG